ncbi:hypothetical protein EI77_02309 [Prosthecobacter fusiformis]|uniref:Uncharacterized protein n=1 Tax=Prosthecobacter fusiformis TaxID=48464 RepID=A0A4R7S2G1_9BACT|nr:hypothetical protein EI77_02309 [Prosthecobacter fusiformis]
MEQRVRAVENREQHIIDHDLMKAAPAISNTEGIGSTKKLYRWQEKMIYNEDGQ